MEQHYLSWDDYFMGIAVFTSLRSKDPNSKVGAVIVNKNKRIVGTGYNGFPAGCNESFFPWEREGNWLDTKYPYVVHAEANAILSATTHDLNGGRIYTTLFPCNECAKFIAQKGIKEVVYLSDKYHTEPFHQAAVKIFESKNIKTRKLAMTSLTDILKNFEKYFRDYGIL